MSTNDQSPTAGDPRSDIQRLNSTTAPPPTVVPASPRAGEAPHAQLAALLRAALPAVRGTLAALEADIERELGALPEREAGPPLKDECPTCGAPAIYTPPGSNHVVGDWAEEWTYAPAASPGAEPHERTE